MGKYKRIWKINAGSAVSLLAAMLTASTFAAEATPPAWAYPVNPPGFTPRQETGVPQQVPGSAATYTITQLRDRFLAPVWHPDEHPDLGDIFRDRRFGRHRNFGRSFSGVESGPARPDRGFAT